MEFTFIREVSVSYRGAKRKAPVQIIGPDKASDFFRKVMPDNSREHFIALYLDGAHVVIAYSVVTTGTAKEVQHTFCKYHHRRFDRCFGEPVP